MPTFTPPNGLPYRSAAQTNALPSGAPRRRYVLPDSCQIRLAAYGLDQTYEMVLSSFPPAQLNCPASDGSVGGLSDTKAILVNYSQPAATGAGMGVFDASFQVVPASWDDFSKTISYTFPGFPGLFGAQYTRNTFTDTVPVRIRYDYYVVDPAGVLGTAPTSGGGVVTTSSVKDSGGSADVKRVYSLADIPIIAKTNFVTVYSGAAQPATRVNSLIKSGGENIGGIAYQETLPTRENYIAWVAKAASDRWASTVWDGTYANQGTSTIGQFVIDDSRLEPLAGNIIARLTTYILAK